MFLCGFKRFGHQEKGKRCSSKDKVKKNPYAEVGLHKFHALLAELDEKKEMIYEEMGCENISLIRFVYDSQDHLKPIVVKAKKKNIDHKKFLKKQKDLIPKRSITLTNSSVDQRFRLDNYYSFHVMLLFALMFLVVFRPFFAIICTFMAWYFAEEVSPSSSSSRIKNR